IAQQPNANKQYAAVFEQFVAGLSLVMLGASLFVKPVLGVLATSDYSAAADLVPVICLAYLCFSLHEHFRVPVLLSRQTLSLVPVYGFAALLNLACNVVLIPRWHAEGAAWASVLTYAGFSFFGLMRYRQIDAYPYSFLRSGEIVAGMILTWIACRFAWDVTTGLGVHRSASAGRTDDERSAECADPKFDSVIL
ncbi:MAG: polysaccharide biosynthesis protein, partial [Planctomycetota bacterium]